MVPSQADSDTESVDSDWVPWMREQGDHAIDDYRIFKETIPGSEKWFPEQEKLHQLCWLRGHHPVLHKSWEYHFLMYGLPQALYAPHGSRKRLAISAKTCDFRGAFEMASPAPRSLETELRYTPPR